jgi:Kae1-associated kinase Bud32
MKTLISQGAEAKIFLEDNQILKQRIVKGYRHPELDETIRKSRTKREGKILGKALALGINVPKVFNLDSHGRVNDRFDLKIKFIEGDKVADCLNDYEEEKQFDVMRKLGEQVSLLHEGDLIHGDLTTSNVLLKDDSVFIIDFGLGFVSKKIEDKAVDLHLIKQALEAKHWQNWEALFDNFLKGYVWSSAEEVVERLKKVEARGRYKGH